MFGGPPWQRFHFLPDDCNGNYSLICGCMCYSQGRKGFECPHDGHDHHTFKVDLLWLAEHSSYFREEKERLEPWRIERAAEEREPIAAYKFALIRPHHLGQEYILRPARSVAALLCAMMPGDRRFIEANVGLEFISEALALSREWGTSDQVREKLLAAAYVQIGHKGTNALHEAQYKNLVHIFIETYRYGPSASELLFTNLGFNSRKHCSGGPVQIAPLNFDGGEDYLEEEGVKYWKATLRKWARARVVSARKPKKKPPLSWAWDDPEFLSEMLAEEDRRRKLRDAELAWRRSKPGQSRAIGPA